MLVREGSEDLLCGGQRLVGGVVVCVDLGRVGVVATKVVRLVAAAIYSHVGYRKTINKRRNEKNGRKVTEKQFTTKTMVIHDACPRFGFKKGGKI